MKTYKLLDGDTVKVLKKLYNYPLILQVEVIASKEKLNIGMRKPVKILDLKKLTKGQKYNPYFDDKTEKHLLKEYSE